MTARNDRRKDIWESKSGRANTNPVSHADLCLFLLLTQLILALHPPKIKVPSAFSPKTTRALIPTILLNTIGSSLMTCWTPSPSTSSLPSLSSLSTQASAVPLSPCSSSSQSSSSLTRSPSSQNQSLAGLKVIIKDEAAHDPAEHHRPLADEFHFDAIPIPLSCSLVTTSFFTTIFLDSTTLSTLGIVCGTLSYLVTALYRHEKVSWYPGCKWQRHSPVVVHESRQLFSLHRQGGRHRQAFWSIASLLIKVTPSITHRFPPPYMMWHRVSWYLVVWRCHYYMQLSSLSRSLPNPMLLSFFTAVVHHQ